jgi:hypothetical protein
MTEAEWLACRDPDALLAYLRQEAYRRRGPFPSHRKLRLFACACCRRVWSAIADDRSRWAVEVAERYADRLTSRHELVLGFAAARAVAGNGGFAAAAAAALSGNLDRAATQAALAGDACRWAEERAGQADLLRDIFGNPFLPRPTVEPAWRSRNEAAVTALAHAAYDERAFGRLPRLAGLLEGAEGTSPGLLAHLRGPGPHVRGCWAIDLILGKS